MRPFIRYIQNTLRFWINPYMDDLMIAISDKMKLATGGHDIGRLLRNYGLSRKLDKGCWEVT